MKKCLGLGLICAMLAGLFAGCGQAPGVNEQAPENHQASAYTGIRIRLSDGDITVDEPQSDDGKSAVEVAHDIVYYEAGKDFTYGEGTEEDAHSAEEAAAHTVVRITKPGQYILTGKLSKGQIAVDLGEDAKDDPGAVVTLVLENADITCTVAPAVIFYNVYECGTTETASAVVDTAAAGANVIIADGSVNNIQGAYVAKIYKPDSLELSQDGTEVLDAKKLHKYDAAFYSKMSMNVTGGPAGSGVLNITASNEGLDSELHLTVNGGIINIVSGNDGINTNEDGVSVTTINGGRLNILVDGATGEGDGIDSNGYLVINGGTVIAQACAFSGDAGIDSDMGIHINGGTVFATGNMLDRIGQSAQNFAVFQFQQSQKAGKYTLKNSENDVIAGQEIENDFLYLIISAEDLAAGEYTLWKDDTQLQVAAGEAMGGFGGGKGEWQEGQQPPEMPEGERSKEEWQEGQQPPEMPEGEHSKEEWQEGQQPPEMPEGERPEGEWQEGQRPPEMPEGERPEGEWQEGQRPEGMERPQYPGGMGQADMSAVFRIQTGGNYFLVMG